jgi:glucan biosynthesis protein
MEIPTTGETLDNVVCFWQPEKAVEAGDELDFKYRLYWSASRRCVLRWPTSSRPAPAWVASRKAGHRAKIPESVGASLCH